jgi:hypothetical protein
MGVEGHPDDAESVRQFISQLQAALTDAVNNPSRLGGIRGQALVANLVVALNECQMMLTVDAGDIYADGPLSSGDFLPILRDGRRLLVELKTVASKPARGGRGGVRASGRRKLSAKEVDGPARTAALLDAAPYYAVFEVAALWAVVRLDNLTKVKRGTGYELVLEDVMVNSHLSILGDRWIGLVPPIEVVIHPNPDDAPPADRFDGSAEITIPFHRCRA